MKSKIKFFVLSIVGMILFFLPVWQKEIPVVVIINGTKGLFGDRLESVAVTAILLLALGCGISPLRVGEGIRVYFAGAGLRRFFWAGALVIVFLKLFQAPVFFLQNPEIGGRILKLGSTIFITIAIAGGLVIFITHSGLVEFIAVLMEPLMKPVFRLPGEAAVNIISSFVSSASVGVYLSEQYYKKGIYTTRQVCSVVVNFSVVSVGYIGVIASLAGVEGQYGALLAASFISVLLMGAVMIRIPPLSGMEDRGYKGAVRKEEKAEFTESGNRLLTAVEAGCRCAEGFTLESLLRNAGQSLLFAQKIVGVMVPAVTLALTLVHYTPIFTWLGEPLVPLLSFVRVPDAALAAPSVLIGIVEVSLPSILIGRTAAGAQTRFFVALLSIIQIVFFSEAGNAILASEIPIGFKKLVGIFLIRTLIGIPIAAFFAWLVCGL